MGFFRWLRWGSAGTDLLRLQIIMDFSVMVQQGVAAVRWASLAQVSPEIEILARITLVILFYIEILWAHDETRGELFTRIDGASQEILHSDGNSSFKFENWEVYVLGKGYILSGLGESLLQRYYPGLYPHISQSPRTTL